MRSSRENFQPRPSLIDRAIARSIWQGLGQRFSSQDRTFKVNELFITWHFGLFCKPVIGLRAFQENNALQLANQSACYSGYKNKPDIIMFVYRWVWYVVLVFSLRLAVVHSCECKCEKVGMDGKGLGFG